MHACIHVCRAYRGVWRAAGVRVGVCGSVVWDDPYQGRVCIEQRSALGVLGLQNRGGIVGDLDGVLVFVDLKQVAPPLLVVDQLFDESLLLAFFRMTRVHVKTIRGLL